MARTIDPAFYHTQQWKRTRRLYKASVGGLCENCLKHDRITPAVCVHHIEELTPDNIHQPEIAYGFGNLMALCNECHNEIHGRQAGKRYEVMPDGEIKIK